MPSEEKERRIILVGIDYKKMRRMQKKSESEENESTSTKDGSATVHLYNNFLNHYLLISRHLKRK